MKIEICESLCASWLKHKKRCLLVQTNWKVSPTWHTHRNKKIKDLVRDDILKSKDNQIKVNNIHIFNKTMPKFIIKKGNNFLLEAEDMNGQSLRINIH